MNKHELIAWLMEGDVSIQYQTQRDLLGIEEEHLRSRIAEEGWGAAFLSKRHSNGHWGQRYYQPKWTSSHYTLLDLKNLGIDPGHLMIKESIHQILDQHIGPDGGVNPSGEIKNSDVCMNGMFLNFATYFKMPQVSLCSIVDFILSQKMADGGFNCRKNRSGARHSSLHSTLSVLEGIREYHLNGYAYRLDEMLEAEKAGQEFMLLHQLFMSDKTGMIIHKDLLRLAYPRRWKFDILSALDYLRLAEVAWDERLEAALGVLMKKRNKDGTWNVQARHPGKLHFEMEKAGKPSRWNTLRALRVIDYFENHTKCQKKLSSLVAV